MICADLVQVSGGDYAVSTDLTNPLDMRDCAVVLPTGSDANVLSSLAYPPPADFAQAWGLGFSLVVGCYLIAWGAGAVLRFLGRY